MNLQRPMNDRRTCGKGEWGTLAFVKLGAHVKIGIGGTLKEDNLFSYNNGVHEAYKWERTFSLSCYSFLEIERLDNQTAWGTG